MLANLSAPQLNALYGKLLTEGNRKRLGGLSPTSVHLVHVTIGRALGDAVKWGMLVRNVAPLAEPPQAKKGQMSVWSPEQLNRFLDHVATDRLTALWHLLAMKSLNEDERLLLAMIEQDRDRQTRRRVGGQAGGNDGGRHRRGHLLGNRSPTYRPGLIGSTVPDGISLNCGSTIATRSCA